MSEYKRFLLCKQCARNQNEGFTGPPECDEQILPGMNGTCDKYTKNLDDVKPAEPLCTIAKATLDKALTLLKPVAARARFAGSSPIMVALAPGGAIELRATDGETDLRISNAAVNGNAKRVVVPHDELLAAAQKEQEPLKMKVVSNGLAVAGTVVAGSAVQAAPGAFEVGEVGLGVEVPKLAGSCTYLVRAVSRDESRPALRYVLLEVPTFTFVATDGHRLHVQYATEDSARIDASVLLTKEQLPLLWAELGRKQLAITSKGCLVTGTMDGFQVEMAFTTGAAQFPEWRTLVKEEAVKAVVGTEELRRAVRSEGKLYETCGVKVLKEYLQDAIVGWEEARVNFSAKDATSPLVLSNGKDRVAVLIYATEDEVTEPVAKEGEMKDKKEKKAKVEKATVQTSAPVAVASVAKNFAIGQELTTPTGGVKILKDRVAYLVQLPSGKKRWFSQDGLTAFIAGQPVEETNEAAA